MNIDKLEKKIEKLAKKYMRAIEDPTEKGDERMKKIHDVMIPLMDQLGGIGGEPAQCQFPTDQTQGYIACDVCSYLGQYERSQTGQY